MGSAAVQMNTRINPDLKAKGDAALSRAGFTPSTAVRALWALAARHMDEPEKIRQMLNPESDDDFSSEQSRRLAAIEFGPSICEEFLNRYRMPDAAAYASNEEPTYEELRQLAWDERFSERGLS